MSYFCYIGVVDFSFLIFVRIHIRTFLKWTLFTHVPLKWPLLESGPYSRMRDVLVTFRRGKKINMVLVL